MSDPAGPLVSTAWLARRLGLPTVKVLDASWFLPAENRHAREEHDAEHIPGAVFFDIDEIADHDTDLPHMLPELLSFTLAAGHLGLRHDTTVVVYDSVGIRSAARVWWTLRVMGFPDVRVLDGGLPKWRAEQRPTEAGRAYAARTLPTPIFRSSLVRGLDDIRRASEHGCDQLVDARSRARFRGEAPEPRPGLRQGHMPGALNVPWDEVVTPRGVLKSARDLKGAFDQAGVDLKRSIVVTCGSGVTAAVLALALARLGRNDVAVYDGSWAEWGARSDTHVVTGRD